jgi:OPA family sugar phosphate sensor protein UhpC-like MFS transporter
MNFTDRLKDDPKFFWEMLLLVCIYGAYAVLNICRTTVVISSPAMLDDPALELNKTMWGAILGWGTAGTLVGKLTTGIMADRFGGRKVFLISIGICMLATGIFGMASKVFFFSIAFFIAMLAKSAGWPSMANLIKSWYPKFWWGRIWGILSSSSMSSSLFTSLVMGSLLLVISWRWVIASSLPLAGIFSILLFFYLKQSPTDVGFNAIPSVDGDEKNYNPKTNHHLDNASLREALISFLKSSRFWLISISIMSLTILMGFQSFLPLYLKEIYNLSPGKAGIASSVFPLGSMFSVLIGGFIFDKLTKKRRIFVLGGMMILATGCIVALLSLPDSNIQDTLLPWIALLVIMVFGLVVAPCYLIPMSVFSLDFGGKHCGVLVGIIDAIGYSALMIFEFSGGVVADQVDGWQQFLHIILNVSIIGTITLILFLIIDHRSLSKSKNIAYKKVS